VRKDSGRPIDLRLGAYWALSGHMPGDSPDPLTGPWRHLPGIYWSFAPRTTRQIDHWKVKYDAHAH